MPIEIFFTFLSYAAVTAVTPGPNNILALSSAGSYGLRGSLPVLLGMWAGFMTVMLLCGAFALVLAAALPQATSWLRWLGAAYILWLAWHVLVSEVGEGKGRAPGFWAGVALQFVNVKIILYGVTAMVVFVLPHHNSTVAVAGYAVVLACIGTFFNSLWALAGRALQNAFRRHGRVINAVLAVSLLGCVVQMLI